MQLPFLLLVAALTLFAILAVGGAVLMVLMWHREAEIARARLTQDPSSEQRAPATGKAAVLNTLQRVGEAFLAGKVNRSLQSTLTSAGVHGRTGPAVYLGTKVLLFALGLVGFALALWPASGPALFKLFFIFSGAALMFFVPNLALALRRAKRTREITSKLPDAVDLLEVSVSSGMGIESAWNAVAVEIRRVSPMLADEMELTTLEIGLGVERATAMRHLAERTGADDIYSLVSLLTQAERFGSSIAEALQVFAKSLRQIQSARAEEAAEKMAVKMLFPMVMFIFPALLVVMAGPAMVKLVENVF